MKYVPGLMVGQLSGKAGSTVASRNRAGSYFRTRTIPKLVRNNKTTVIRNQFTANSQAYRNLTDAQRFAWAALGGSITKKNSLGETIRLTGSQAFQSINSNLVNSNQSAVQDAPPLVDAPELSGFDFSVVSGGPGTTTVIAGANSATQNVTSTASMYAGANLSFPATGEFRQVVSITDATHVVLNLPIATTTADTIDWTDLPTMNVRTGPSPFPTGLQAILSMTAPLSAGISRPSRGAYRVVDIFGAGHTSPTNVALSYFLTFGLPPAGSKIFGSLKPISSSGIAATATVFLADVT